MKKHQWYILSLILLLSGCGTSTFRPFILYKHDGTIKEDLTDQHDKMLSSAPFSNKTTLNNEDFAYKRETTFYSTPIVEDKNTKLEITSKELRIRKSF